MTESGVYVAVGDQGSILTSTDAVQWWLVDTPDSVIPYLYGIAYANGAFVAVGRDERWFDPQPLILRSTDGYGWSAQDLPFGSQGWLVGVAAGNGGLIA